MISTGSGKVAAMNAETYKQMKSCTVEGGVTSLALNKKGHEVSKYPVPAASLDVFMNSIYLT